MSAALALAGIELALDHHASLPDTSNHLGPCPFQPSNLLPFAAMPGSVSSPLLLLARQSAISIQSCVAEQSPHRLVPPSALLHRSSYRPHPNP
eukprot:1556813-Rhodomonas_salina.1